MLQASIARPPWVVHCRLHQAAEDMLLFIAELHFFDDPQLDGNWRSRADQFCHEYQNQIQDWMRMMQDINKARVRSHYAEGDRERVSCRLCGRVIADRGEALVLHLYASHNDEWRAAMSR